MGEQEGKESNKLHADKEREAIKQPTVRQACGNYGRRDDLKTPCAHRKGSARALEVMEFRR